MIASDVIVQSNRAWTPEVRSRLEAILASGGVVARTESIETPTMVRADNGDATARMVELRAVEAAFPFYGTLALADGRPYAHEMLAGRGTLVGPELLAQLGVGVGDTLVIAGQPFEIRGVIASEPGRRIGAFSLRRQGHRRSRRSRSYGPARVRQPRQLSAAAEGGGGRRRSADAARSPGAAGLVRHRPLVPGARGRHRRGSRTGRELSQPCRLRHRRARRHRRLERHPRLRAAEDQERRDPQVSRRDDGAGAGDLCRADRAAWACRRPGRRPHRRGCHAIDPGVARGRVRRRQLRPHHVGDRAGRCRRPAGVAAVRARPAARSPPRQTAAVAARAGHHPGEPAVARPCRLAAGRDGGAGDGRARRRRGLAGRVAAGRRARVRRFCRRRAGAVRGGVAAL